MRLVCVKTALCMGLTSQLRLKPIATTLVGGSLFKVCLDRVGERRAARILAAEQEAAEQLRRNNAIMDVYGDRSSLGELERAVEFYDKRL